HRIDRRAFLRSSAGLALTLATLGACSDAERRASGRRPSAGSFDVPPTTTTDPDAATTTLAPFEGEVVIDVQTHFLEPDTVGFGRGFPQAACGDDPSLCFTIDRWADLVLASSDTSVAVLSALPIVADDHPMTIEKMESAKRLADALCGDGRVLLQGEAFPQVGELTETLDRMETLASSHRIVAWKTYTHIGRGYSFTDPVGEALLARVADLAARGIGPRVVCVHKGFGADPADVGPAAAAHPELTFCVYHSGFEPGRRAEGPFDERGTGVDRLIRSLRDAGIGPGANVYAELGSTWYHALRDPDEAAHVLGKLLVAVGPERILWGTDSVWYGSPQDQIEAFRAFTISPEAQERFGYPALTDEVKRLVLGANAARLHGLDLASLAEACRFSPDERAAARGEALGRLGPMADEPLGPATASAAAATFASANPWLR
ncbi:MAG TPA: amidohydrolase family protein, partial [Acidimicrobiales bacterium]